MGWFREGMEDAPSPTARGGSRVWGRVLGKLHLETQSRKSSRLCNPAWHSKSATCLSRVACSDNAARLDSSAVISKSAMFINYQVNHICRSCVSLGVFSFCRSLDLDGRPGCHGNGSMWVNSHAARSARSSFWVPHWDCMHVCLLHNQWSCHVKCNCILHS